MSLAATAPAQYTNGIYAEFNTSMGSYTCRLDHVVAPQAVANFIGLATGERAWLDLPTGLVKTNPFYNGTIFHRVIAGFMNQGGSRNGLGTDGPGYAFVDEFSPNVRHDGFGVLSMANSGPDSNGSQVFITVAPTPWLDDVHTIFGRLYGGSNVVYAINNVATGANNRPLTNVVIESVVIRRIGSEAQNFDIHSQGLPVVRGLSAKISVANTNVTLSFSNQFHADTRLYTSTNLNQWSAITLGIETALSLTNQAFRTVAAAKEFFRLTQIQYASSTFAPKNWFGRTLALTFTNGASGVVSIQFNSSGGGDFNYNGSPGTVTSYDWTQLPYNGRIWPIIYSAIVPPMTLALNFPTATAGGFTGTVYPNYPFTIGAYAVSGSFTNSP